MRFLAALLAFGAAIGGAASAQDNSDVLYVGDAGIISNVHDDTIKRFDARTGTYLGVLVQKGPLIGPMGLIVSEGL